MYFEETILYIHYLIIFFVLITPFISPLKYLDYYAFFILIMIFHWYFFEGQCIISKFHKNETENQDVMTKFFLKFNIPFFVYDLVLYTLILMTFYRLNNIKAGILSILSFLIVNKLFYGNFKIKIY